MERLDTGEDLDKNCHTCGMEIKENGVVGWSSGNHYCSFECLQKKGQLNKTNANANANK